MHRVVALQPFRPELLACEDLVVGKTFVEHDVHKFLSVSLSEVLAHPVDEVPSPDARAGLEEGHELRLNHAIVEEMAVLDGVENLFDLIEFSEGADNDLEVEEGSAFARIVQRTQLFLYVLYEQGSVLVKCVHDLVLVLHSLGPLPVETPPSHSRLLRLVPQVERTRNVVVSVGERLLLGQKVEQVLEAAVGQLGSILFNNAQRLSLQVMHFNLQRIQTDSKQTLSFSNPVSLPLLNQALLSPHPQVHFLSFAVEDLNLKLVHCIKSHLCGLANSGGGSLLIGVKEGVIEGLLCTQEQKEGFKKLMNRVGQQFYPQLKVSRGQLQINYLPVLDASFLHIQGRYLIQITLSPLPNFLYSFRSKLVPEDLFFVRRSGTTEALTSPQEIYKEILRRRNLEEYSQVMKINSIQVSINCLVVRESSLTEKELTLLELTQIPPRSKHDQHVLIRNIPANRASPISNTLFKLFSRFGMNLEINYDERWNCLRVSSQQNQMVFDVVKNRLLDKLREHGGDKVQVQYRQAF